MLNLKYKDATPLVRQSEEDKRWIVGNIIVGIFSFVNGAWEFGLVCVVMCVAYIYLYRKHKAREQEADEMLERFTDDEDDGTERSISAFDRKSRKEKKKEKVERENEYNAFLRQGAADFDTSEIDEGVDYDEDYDDYNDEDKDGFHY